jgi:hypothetical protein
MQAGYVTCVLVDIDVEELCEIKVLKGDERPESLPDIPDNRLVDRITFEKNSETLQCRRRAVVEWKEGIQLSGIERPPPVGEISGPSRRW